MGFTIENGAGTPHPLKIDINNRAHVQAVSEEESLHSSELGNAYNLNTGYITFTGGANGTLGYFKNDEQDDFVIESIALGTGDEGTYTSSPYITIVRNPSGGDLITDASAGSMKQNRNFDSNNVLGTGTLFYKGKVSGTLTGGNDLGILQTSKGGRDFFTLNLIIPRGASIGVKLTNNASGGNITAYLAFVGYIKDPEGKDV